MRKRAHPRRLGCTWRLAAYASRRGKGVELTPRCCVCGCADLLSTRSAPVFGRGASDLSPDMLRSFLALGVLAGCAAPPAILQPADIPIAATSTSVDLDPLNAVRPPERSPALRSSASSMVHSTMTAESVNTPLGDALTAYLAIHAALASDRIVGVADAARDFQSAFALANEDAPADNPHVWHMHADETDAVQAHASSLAQAEDLTSARAAFGNLSEPFALLVEAVGAPSGFDLVRHTCGMQSGALEGGVWLQRAGEVQNPYFGGAMQMCAQEPSPTSDGIEVEGATDSHMSHRSR